MKKYSLVFLMIVCFSFTACTATIDQNNLQKSIDLCKDKEGIFSISQNIKTNMVTVRCKDGSFYVFKKFETKGK